MKSKTNYYKDISTLLKGLQTVTPISESFHIHQFKDTPDTWIKETTIFRSNTYAIILLTKGKAKYKIGLSEYIIGDNSLYFMAPKHLRYYNRLSDWEGFVIVFMDSFITDNDTLKKLVSQFEGFGTASKVVINLTSEETEESKRIFQWLYDIAYTESPLKFEKARALLGLLMIHSTELYSQKYKYIDAKLSKQHRIIKAFDQIIEEHLYDITQDRVSQILSIAEIAGKININATYLGEVVKKHTGKTPKQILSERIILEAKSFLRNTDMSISEIAFMLKFQDASNFSKFFKAKTGISPTFFK
ncbi:MAG: helix-turn-helix transcriptional regulator [Bacteroidota bacterium]